MPPIPHHTHQGGLGHPHLPWLSPHPWAPPPAPPFLKDRQPPDTAQPGVLPRPPLGSSIQMSPVSHLSTPRAGNLWPHHTETEGGRPPPGRCSASQAGFPAPRLCCRELSPARESATGPPPPRPPGCPGALTPPSRGPQLSSPALLTWPPTHTQSPLTGVAHTSSRVVAETAPTDVQPSERAEAHCPLEQARWTGQERGSRGAHGQETCVREGLEGLLKAEQGA